MVFLEGNLAKRGGFGRDYYFSIITMHVVIDPIDKKPTSETLYGNTGGPGESRRSSIGGDMNPNAIINATEDKDGSGLEVAITYLPPRTLGPLTTKEDYNVLPTKDNTVVRRISNTSTAISGSLVTPNKKRSILTVVVTHAP